MKRLLVLLLLGALLLLSACGGGDETMTTTTAGSTTTDGATDSLPPTEQFRTTPVRYFGIAPQKNGRYWVSVYSSENPSLSVMPQTQRIPMDNIPVSLICVGKKRFENLLHYRTEVLPGHYEKYIFYNVEGTLMVEKYDVFDSFTVEALRGTVLSEFTKAQWTESELRSTAADYIRSFLDIELYGADYKIQTIVKNTDGAKEVFDGFYVPDEGEVMEYTVRYDKSPRDTENKNYYTTITCNASGDIRKIEHSSYLLESYIRYELDETLVAQQMEEIKALAALSYEFVGVSREPTVVPWEKRQLAVVMEIWMYNLVWDEQYQENIAVQDSWLIVLH